MTSSDPNHALITPGRVMGDFRTWLEHNATALQLSPEDVDYYARCMTTAVEFGWVCKGEKEARGYRFIWRNTHGTVIEGSFQPSVYGAFLSSLRKRHHYLRTGDKK